MGGLRCVIVPVHMRDAASVHVPMNVTRHPRTAGRQRQIERVAGECVTGMFVILAVVVIMDARMRMGVVVSLPRRRTHVAERRQGDPAAETDERQARGGIDKVFQSGRSGGAGNPAGNRNHQCRADVPHPGDDCGARRLSRRPAALPRNRDDRRPVIGDVCKPPTITTAPYRSSCGCGAITLFLSG